MAIGNYNEDMDYAGLFQQDLSTLPQWQRDAMAYLQNSGNYTGGGGDTFIGPDGQVWRTLGYDPSRPGTVAPGYEQLIGASQNIPGYGWAAPAALQNELSTKDAESGRDLVSQALNAGAGLAAITGGLAALGPLSGAAALGGIGEAGSSLPESYWSALADSGGFISDAAAANAGTLGELGTGAFDLGGLTGTGLEAGMAAGPSTLGGFTIGEGLTAAQAAELAGIGGSELGALNAGAGAFDAAGATGTGLEYGMQPGPATSTGFTINPGQTAAQAAAGAGIGSILPTASGGSGGFTIPGTDITIPNNVLSGILQGGLGYLGAGEQADAFRDVVNQNLALGDWSRQQYKNTFTDPNYLDIYKPAFDRAADISSRSWAAKAGNPAGNPTAQAGILSDVWTGSMLPMLSNDRATLSNTGNWGLGTAGNAQMMGAQQAGSGLDAIGYGIGTALNQQPDWAKILQGMGGNQSPFSLNIGGMKWGGR